MAAGEGHGTRAIVAALFANLGIAIAKFVAFAFTGSSSMLAEGVHSVADTGNQALLLYGSRRGSLEPTPEHPFGYGRERYFWAFVVALVLFSLGSLFALYEAWHKLQHPEAIESPAWAFGVLIVGIGLESYSLRTAIVESRKVKGDASWISFIRHTKSPELPVVLLEDIGAMAGLVIALIAITIAVVADAPVWDGIGTATIGVLLGVIAIVLALEMRSLLIGETASRKDLDTIRAAIEGHDKVVRIIHMRTQHMGPEELLVGVKVDLAPGLDTASIAHTINEIEQRIREAVPVARIIYIEPDLYRTLEAEQG
jgi:cation diffusion facilitator family transporter